MGKTEKRELISRLAVLLQHLLKWQLQPARRSARWEATIIVQRQALARHLKDNPSLKAKLDDAITDGFSDAVPMAMGETELPRAIFPSACPLSFTQIMDPAFWPAPSPGRGAD